MKHMWRVKMGFGIYNFIHKISNTNCALKGNEIVFKVQDVEKANKTESTS